MFMPRISDQEIQQLKEEVSVERLVESSGVVLKKSGKDRLGRCPFHEDGEPSLVVTPGKNLWHCFGCGVGGGPIDWVIKQRGVSFRHAVELLREGLPSLAAGAAGVAAGQTPTRPLPAPIALDANDQQLLDETLDYYHQRLKQTPEALAYLQSRGLDHPELVEHFKLGVADRTLGLRLPEKNRKAGADIRARLQRVGLLRESGHEHFNGSLVVPVVGLDGHVREVYGRKLRDDLRPGTPKHLYLPGPHAGVFNGAGLVGSTEVILCEALIDALTFWCAGYRHVTSSFGVEGFTDDIVAAFKRHGVRRVLIAYDRDEAGDRGAAKVAAQLMAEGLECWRIEFPRGMDANAYACKVQPAGKSLGLLIRQAVWLGNGVAPARAAERAQPQAQAQRVPDSPPASSLAAGVMAEPLEPAPAGGLPVTTPVAEPLPASPCPEVLEGPLVEVKPSEQGSEVTLTFAGSAGAVQARRWRVRGLAKNLAVGVLKVNVMVTYAGLHASEGAAFHVDTLDLYAARARSHYVTQAAQETGLAEAVLKADLGRVLLALERVQDEVIAEVLQPEPLPQMSAPEQDAALALLKSPELIERILGDFAACGLVGEETNKLVGYLAAVSRKLERPLGVVVQSSSAAGKSSLMDAVLAFVPEEEKVKYSAMTGQSLFYMGETNLKHKALAIVEEEGASRASYALKLLQSEGELTIASTGKDPNTGNLITQQYRVEGPVALLLTTTARDIDEELMNRCLVLAVDEGREQTRAIHERQRQRRTLEGLLGGKTKAALVALHQNAQRLLKPLDVLNPYAQWLTFPDQTTRLRRDHEKYLTLIDTIAFVHQHQRRVKTAQQGDKRIEYIEATLGDIERANAIAQDVLGRSLDELPPQTRRLLTLVDQYVVNQCAGQQIKRFELRFSRRSLREAISWGDTQLKLHLARLVELEYLVAHRTRSGGFEYELVYELSEAAGRCLVGLADIEALKKAHEQAHEPASAHHYDMARSGLQASRSAHGRGVVGVQSVGGRADQNLADPAAMRVVDDLSEDDGEMHVLRRKGQAMSYPQGAQAAQAAQGAALCAGAAGASSLAAGAGV
jgi:DNA primase